MSLLTTITDRAERSFSVPRYRVDFVKKWIPHWFATAEQCKAEAEAEGLVKTAEEIQRIIDEQRLLTPEINQSH